MDNKDLQVENGNFTRIVNPVIMALIQLPFKGCELAVAIYIIRKTWGYNKTEDEIPLSQFQTDLKRSRQTIVTALKNLQLVKVARLVKRGDAKFNGNIWKINKYIDTWELVNIARLVQRKRGTSLTEGLQLVKTARHSKDTQKTISKDNIIISQKQKNKDFFDLEEKQLEVYDFLLSKGIGQETAKTELKKFISYWTEPNSTGTKQRWELEKTFEIGRRLTTWFNNKSKNFNQQNYGQPKGINL